MVQVTLAVRDPARVAMDLEFVNTGQVAAILDRRRACLAGWVPMGVLQISEARRWIGLRACSLGQDDDVRLRLAPGERVRTTFALGEWFATAQGAPLKVRYAATHRNPDTDEVIELVSNAVPVRF